MYRYDLEYGYCFFIGHHHRGSNDNNNTLYNNYGTTRPSGSGLCRSKGYGGGINYGTAFPFTKNGIGFVGDSGWNFLLDQKWNSFFVRG